MAKSYNYDVLWGTGVFFFFLAVLGHFGVWLFSSCWQSTGSRVHRLSSCGLGALAGSMWDFSSLTGIELMSPALECLFLNHWTTREVLMSYLFIERNFHVLQYPL